MTTKMLEKILVLAKEGWCDAEIARQTGLSPATVCRWRMKFGVPIGKKGKNTWPRARVWTVYDKHTDEYVCEGTAVQIADYLGRTRNAVESAIWHYLNEGKGRYAFCEVEE